MAKIDALTVDLKVPGLDYINYLQDKVGHQKIVIKNLQGVQEQFIKSQEKKNAQIKALRDMVAEAYEEGRHDEADSTGKNWQWEDSDMLGELNKMFPPEE